MALADDGSDVVVRRMKPNWWAVWEGCNGSSHVFLRVTRDHVTVISKLDPAFCLNTNPSGLQGAAETLCFQGSQCHYSRMANILYRQESGPM